MKKILILISFGFCIQFNLTAQKIYRTSTGQIKFFSTTPIEDIEAVNNEVDSKFSDKTGQITFDLLIKGFRFENGLMQQHFNEDYMESSKYPKASFRGYITNITQITLAKEGKYAATAEGDLTIHGVTKKIKVNGTIEKNNKGVTLKGTFKIQLADFKIQGDYIGDKIAKDVQVIVNCNYQ